VITVHALENSRAHRILWLLEEMSVPYNVISYARDPRTLAAPPELRDIHPLGKSPVVTDGDLVIAESGAIIEYLLTRAPHELTPSGPAHLRYVYWMHHAEGSAMPPLLDKLMFDMLPGLTPFLIRPVARAIAKGVLKARIDPEVKRLADYWESELGPDGWFAGDQFSAADIQMSYPVEAFAARSNMIANYPNLRRFLTKARDRPAYLAAARRSSPTGNGSPIPRLG
jgi:glutathione S-transferase